jgi:S1-C subfamily serine protease
MKLICKAYSLAPLLLLLLCFAIADAQDQKPQPPATQPLSGGGQSLDSRFRLVRSVSGSKVVDNGGRLSIEDARSVFYVPSDKEIDVYFTWEGPPGLHHFEGVWKKPDGKVTMISDFDYQADQPRFGGYFRMLLGDTPALGVWALEARIDGESAGTHSFQIIGATRPETPLPVRRMLIPAEIYKRAAATSVFIENLNQLGERRSQGSGFFIGPDHLVTAFQVVDGASKVRILTPDGRRVEASEVIAWNRREDWMILRFDAAQIPPMQMATTDAGAVGDRVYVLDVPAEGSRVLIEASIIGKQRLSNAGDRLSIGDNLNRRSLGSPLLNEYGEVIGLVGGSLIPGSAFVEDMVFSARSLGGSSRGTSVVPIELIGHASSATLTTTIADLAKSGQFMSPLVGNENVLSGTLSRNLNRKTDPPQTIEERSEFSRQDARIMVLVTWLPREKRKGIPSLQLYDLDNRLLSESPGKKKISVSPQKLSYSAWEFPLGNLPAGIYRLDVSLNSDTVWRTFFRIVD